MKSPLVARLFLSAFAGMTVFLLLMIVWQKQMSIENLGHFISEKNQLERPVMGALHYTHTRVALAGYRLNLGAWFSDQMLWLKKGFTLRQGPIELSFKMRLPLKSYLAILYNRHREGYDGVLISHGSYQRQAFFTSDQFGTFSRLQEWSHPQVEEFLKQDAQMIVKLVMEKSATTLWLNGQVVASRIQENSDLSLLGLTAGPEDEIYVDDWQVRQNGKILFSEGFAPWPRQWFWWVGVTVLLCSLSSINLPLTWAKRMLLGHVTINACLLLYGLADGYYFSSWIRPTMITSMDPRQKIELSPQVAERLSQFPPRPKGELRVLLLGGSQTWGAGAKEEEHSLEKFFEAKMKAHWPCVRVINAASGGAVVASLTTDYLAFFRKLGADFVILNVGYNDSFNSAFPRELATLMGHLKEDAAVFLIVEAAEPTQGAYFSFFQRRAQSIDLARTHGWPFMDPQMQLWMDGRDSFFWWDRIHLTSAGQRALVEILWPKLKAAMVNGLKEKSCTSDLL